MEKIEDLARWLVKDAPAGSVEALFVAFCRKVASSAVPIWRASLGLELLHPEVSGWQHIWTDEGLSSNESDRAASTSSYYLNSPTRIVDETGRPFHRRLDVPYPDIPLLEELRFAGATDYVMYPLPFLDSTRTAVISFTTRQADGFTANHLDDMRTATNLLSPYLERQVLRRIAVDLLDTYVGPRTGQQILDGRIDRGAAQLIEAAIWFADLRGFTALSERLPVSEVLAHLNTWFGLLGQVVEAQGGEVLKFIGDAALVIFPMTKEHDAKTACHQALSAARKFCNLLEAENTVRRSNGLPVLRHGLAVHFGEVAYGNVGASHRLDFTVIGPTVNRASRLLELAKHLDQQVVISETVASQVDHALLDLGQHPLRGIEQPKRIFTFA